MLNASQILHVRAQSFCGASWCTVLARSRRVSNILSCHIVLLRVHSLQFHTLRPWAAHVCRTKRQSGGNFLTLTTTMRVSFVTDLGQTYAIEIDPQMELENIMALLEAEVRVPRSPVAQVADRRTPRHPRSLASPCTNKAYHTRAVSSAIPRRLLQRTECPRTRCSSYARRSPSRAGASPHTSARLSRHLTARRDAERPSKTQR